MVDTRVDFQKNATFSTAYEVTHWDRDNKCVIHMFSTFESAESFRNQLPKSTNNIMRVIGVAEFVSMSDGIYRRFSLGPSIDEYFNENHT